MPPSVGPSGASRSPLAARVRHGARLCVVLVFAAWAFVGGPAMAQQPGDNQNPAAVYPAGYSARWIEDAAFVYGPDLLTFDVRQYLAGAAPHLVQYAEVISHWSGYYSISPKLLLTILELRSGAISKGPNPDSLANPSAGLVPGADFETQVRNLLNALFDHFYAYRRLAQPSGDGAINAATFALLNLFRGTAAPAAFAVSVDPLRGDFLTTFSRLFPDTRGEVLTPADAHANAIPPPDLLQLPWKNGTSWYFGGVHTTTGQNNGSPMSSLDFASGGQSWGDDTSGDFVVAAHAGTVTVFSSCNVRVTSPTGWATNYYHLSNVAVANGSQVQANQTLAVYANSLNQALCNGGSSSGPHVHFSLLNNGAFSALDGVALSGYVVHPGRFSYDADPNYMWLEKNGTRYFANSYPIVSTAVGGPPPSGRELLTNGSFGSASTGWIRSGDFFMDSVGVVCRTCPGYAYLADANRAPGDNLAGSFYQTVTIPSNPAAAGLSFWYNIATSETDPVAYDLLVVTIQNALGGHLDTLEVLSNLNWTTGYVRLSADLMAYAGQTIRLHFSATTDITLPTIFRVDDVSILVSGGTLPPTATTGSASAITRTTATLNATVNPNGSSTAASFQFGATVGYGSVFSATPAPGSGTSPVAVSAVVNGLSCATLYHFRVVATSAGGTATGADATLTTAACPPPFTDVPLVSGLSIKAVHFSELRSRINALRIQCGLASFVWTDPSLTPTITMIWSVHITELRAALNAAYAACKRTPPVYRDPTITPRFTPIKAIHIEDLRSAVIALE